MPPGSTAAARAAPPAAAAAGSRLASSRNAASLRSSACNRRWHATAVCITSAVRQQRIGIRRAGEQPRVQRLHQLLDERQS